jgi:hypothetical protein
VIEAVEDMLAVFRLTRLATVDTFPPVQRLRWKILQRWPETDWRVELLTCPWCLSFWFALAAVIVRDRPVWRRVLAPALAGSAVAGILSERT